MLIDIVNVLLHLILLADLTTQPFKLNCQVICNSCIL